MSAPTALLDVVTEEATAFTDGLGRVVARRTVESHHRADSGWYI
ncbi:hypothetical protein [Salinigranum halophilum]|nr:hypothetical protein [Salinigranum halophilum]